MAKALLGHMGNDHLVRAELVSLRARVRSLEAEVARLREVAEFNLPPVERVVDVKDSSFDAAIVEFERATPALA